MTEIDWKDAQAIRSELQCEGWKSPDTYCRFFAPIPKGPAVYLFLLTDMHDFSRGLVAYVGMSIKLHQRLSSHPVYAEIERPGLWPMRWFKPVQKDVLRAIEGQYISKFDPPWNIQGRKRGLSL